MYVDNVIYEALHLPVRAGSYGLGRRLAALFPEQVVVETEDCDFQVEAYAKAGHCTLMPWQTPYAQTLLNWEQEEKPLRYCTRSAWWTVDWQGMRCSLLALAGDEDWAQHFFLVAPAREAAERFFAAVCAWHTDVRAEVLVFEDRHWRKDEDLYKDIRAATFENLVLEPGLKEEVHLDLTRFFDSRTSYERYGVPWKRGVLFIGPPGNGKTHAVKAILNSLGRPCLYVKSMAHDCSTPMIFAQARRQAPCILVFEDLDSLVKEQHRSAFLNEMDGFAANTGILCLATTNHPERLDPALIERPSRFDRTYRFDLPTETVRLEYINRWNASLQPELRLSPAGMSMVACKTKGFSFAYLKELFVSATMRWIASAEAGAMDVVMLEQLVVLRGQMVQVKSTNKRKGASEDRL